MARWVMASSALIFLSACGIKPPLRHLPCAEAPPLSVRPTADGERLTAQFSVLTYNVEGIPWPVRAGRTKKLRDIGDRLAAMHADGSAPDIVLFQEAFSNPAKRAVRNSGYAAIMPGPHRIHAAANGSKEKLDGKSKPLKGEIGIKFVGSGLSIASRYPIIDGELEAFGRKACAGFDCLSNKGIMLARIYLPGVPLPIDIYNTHMNARNASRVPENRNLEAHRRQVQMSSAFIARTRAGDHALIFGGDFNMKSSEPRWEGFSEHHPIELVHSYCVEQEGACDVQMSWDGDAPWMDTQDLQFFAGGKQMTIRPVRVEAMFDGGDRGPKLSDHDGFKVTYQIEWDRSLKAENRPTGTCDI